MRKILLLFLLCSSVGAFGQFPSSGKVQFPTTNGIGYRGTGGDSLLWIPSDTIRPANSLIGRTHIARKGTSLYYWNGTKFVSISGSVPGIDDVLAIGQHISMRRTIPTDGNEFRITGLLNSGRHILSIDDSANVGYFIIGNHLTLEDYTLAAIGFADSLKRSNDSVYARIPNTGWVFQFKDSVGSGGGGIGAFEDSIANVRDYGAVGDGSTDDGIAIKAAIATGRTIYFPKGVYKTDTMLIPSVKKQVFFGDGATSVIYTTQTTHAILKLARGFDSCEVRGLGFRGTGSTSSIPGFTNSAYQMGVWIQSKASVVRDCFFTKLNGRGIFIFDPDVLDIGKCLTDNNYFFQCTVGVEYCYGGDYSTLSNSHFLNCYVGYAEGGCGNIIINTCEATEGNYGMYYRGGAQHGSVVNFNVNHNTSGLYIPAGTLGMTFTNCNFWYSTIDLGATDTVRYVSFVNCVVANTTVNATKVLYSKMTGGYWYGTVSTTGANLQYENIIGSGLGQNLIATLNRVDARNYFDVGQNGHITRLNNQTVDISAIAGYLYLPGGRVYTASLHSPSDDNEYIKDNYTTGVVLNTTGVGTTGQTAFKFTTGATLTTSDLALFNNNGTDKLKIKSDGSIIMYGRQENNQGADVASANNLTLGTDGNTFEITGTTQVNLIDNTGWQNGSVIHLIFTSTPTVKNGQTTSSNNISIKLAGGADFSATADDVLTLMLCEIGGTQVWREVSRSVN